VMPPVTARFPALVAPPSVFLTPGSTLAAPVNTLYHCPLGQGLSLRTDAKRQRADQGQTEHDLSHRVPPCCGEVGQPRRQMVGAIVSRIWK
jgi:hypothetical protein